MRLAPMFFARLTFSILRFVILASWAAADLASENVAPSDTPEASNNDSLLF